MKHISIKQLFWLAGEFMKKRVPNDLGVFEDKTVLRLNNERDLIRDFIMYVWDDRKGKNI